MVNIREAACGNFVLFLSLSLCKWISSSVVQNVIALQLSSGDLSRALNTNNYFTTAHDAIKQLLQQAIGEKEMKEKPS